MSLIDRGNIPDDPKIMDTAEWKEAWRRHEIKLAEKGKEAPSRGTATGAKPKKSKGNTPPPEPSPSASSISSSSSSASSSDSDEKSEESSKARSKSNASWLKDSDDDYVPKSPPPEA